MLLQGSSGFLDGMPGRERSFAAVLLSAVGRWADSDPEAEAVLRKALRLAKGAGFLQAQAQVTCCGSPLQTYDDLSIALISLMWKLAL